MNDKSRSLFSIDEICEAWLEFNKPYWLVDSRQKISYEELKAGGIVRGSDIHQLPINYGDWIPFLVKWKKYNSKGKI